MQATKFFIILLSSIVFLSSVTNETAAQSGNSKSISKIKKQLKPILTNGWTIVEEEKDVVPPYYDDKYRAYMIVLSNPTQTFEGLSKGPSGGMVGYYNPWYRLFLVPRQKAIGFQQLREEYFEARGDRPGRQRSVPIPYGASNEFFLLYEESDRTGWVDGIQRIAEAIKMEPL